MVSFSFTLFGQGSRISHSSELGTHCTRIDPTSRLEVIVCDIDEIQQLQGWQDKIYAGDHTGGGGDLLWIANGVVRARHNASRQCDFDVVTRSLLLECRPC